MSLFPTEAEFQVAFKGRLRRMRKVLGYSQVEMAKRLGVEPNTYAKWEQEKQVQNNFPLHLVPRLCEITGHDPWYVLTEQAPAQRQRNRTA